VRTRSRLRHKHIQEQTDGAYEEQAASKQAANPRRQPAVIGWGRPRGRLRHFRNSIVETRSTSPQCGTQPAVQATAQLGKLQLFLVDSAPLHTAVQAQHDEEINAKPPRRIICSCECRHDGRTCTPRA